MNFQGDVIGFRWIGPLHVGQMKFIEILQDGQPASAIRDLPEIARQVLKSTSEMYQRMGHQPPWIGYLAIDGEKCVGTCAFKTAPLKGRVEIAYFTFPGNEGRNVATRMVRFMIESARQQASNVRVYAQTLPQENASSRVLEKCGFRRIAEITDPEDGKVWEWEIMEKA